MMTATMSSLFGGGTKPYKGTRSRTRRIRHSCGPADEASAVSGVSYWEHRNEGSEPCPKARRENSLAASLRRHIRLGGTVDDWRWKPRGDKEYSCDLSDPVVPGIGHYTVHNRTPEDGGPCVQSLREMSAHYYLKQHGTLEGWEHHPRVDVTEFDCRVHDPFVPNSHHAAWHHRTPGAESCVQSKRERSADVWLKAKGTLDGWNWPNKKGKQPKVYSCVPSDVFEPNGAHWHQHQRTPGGVPCEQSLKERSAYIYRLKYGNLDGWEHRSKEGLRNVPHRLYKVTFLEGNDLYYGITRQPLDIRINYHTAAQSPVGLRITAGEIYTAQVLCEFPNRDEAEQTERLAIRSGNPSGRLLNDAHNPWFGLPGPHWGPVPEQGRV